jgi:hypothetical protein
MQISYLRTIARYEKEGTCIIYSDETCINSLHTIANRWMGSTDGGLKTLTAKSWRLILVHAGGETEFVSNALMQWFPKCGVRPLGGGGAQEILKGGRKRCETILFTKNK